MATIRRKKKKSSKVKKVKGTAKAAPVAKKKRAKKAASSAKEGFPTAREMKAARDSFAETVGPKILTQSQAKALPKAMGLRASADFVDAVAKLVYVEVLKAAKRCVANDRKTLRPSDL